MLGTAFLLLVLLSELGPGSVSKLFEADPFFVLFTPVIISIVIGVSLVLTFNQLVLAQELGPIGDHRKQMAETMSFRNDVEDTVERETSPREPPLFLSELVRSTNERAQTILDLLEDGFGDGVDEIRRYAENVVADADYVAEDLHTQEFGSFGVVGSVLEYNHSRTYILRIVTVTKWTLATDPFILRETDRDSETDRCRPLGADGHDEREHSETCSTPPLAMIVRWTPTGAWSR